MDPGILKAYNEGFGGQVGIPFAIYPSFLYYNMDLFKEAGLPEFEVTTYYGLLVPTGTPADIIGKLSAAMKQIAATPEVQQAFRKQGVDPHPTTPEETDRLIRSEVEKWGGVQKVAKIT